MNIIFYLPAFLFLASGLPQMFQLLRTKKSEDISVSMYLITCTAVIIVIIDAAIHHNTSIMVSNLASLAITGTNTLLVIKYKKKKN
jgi:uncharacterized protein with PQ loop repeat